MDLIERRALVCGSSQGIGKACAMELAARGASVTLVARSEEALQQTLGELPTPSDQLHAMICVDFADPRTLRDLVATEVRVAGAQHILINNTGGPPAGPILDADPAAFVTALEHHVVCNQILAQLLVPGMRQDRYGRIVNIISTSVREPIENLGVSNTIRGAVASWAKTLSRELAPYGITVNNVLPGFTDTARLTALIANRAQREGRNSTDVAEAMRRQVPAGRFARPEEIASVVGFLCSPAASYVNGVSLPVDGGRLHSI
ncbi:MAG: SDR family oxidoreductase [Planctomycetota bacterium]